MEPVSPPEFAQLVRKLGIVAAAAGLEVPGFVSPPRSRDADRTIKWLRGGRALVAVRRGDRAADAVVDDMIRGVIVANGLSGSEASDTARKLAECLRN